MTTTTTPGSSVGRYPDKVVGFYITLADDTVEGYHTGDDWDPKLYEYQQTGANVLFFTFVNPETMQVPKSFQKLAATRGTGVDGAIPKDTKVIFAIGGYSYSLDYNPWKWLTSQEKAEAMAEEVATWPERFGCDGIDLDIEEGAGSRPEAGSNLVHFVRRLRQLRPDIIVGQPAYGFPQVPAESDVINASWNVDSTSNNVADSVGLMVYEGTEALRYVDNYAKGAEQWEGFPIRVNVPRDAILLGCKGVTASQSIVTLADESIRQDLLGVMVWYASVRNGFQYEISWDASTSTDSQHAYVSAMQNFNAHMGK